MKLPPGLKVGDEFDVLQYRLRVVEKDADGVRLQVLAGGPTSRDTRADRRTPRRKKAEGKP
jgi:hypothetical protein